MESGDSAVEGPVSAFLSQPPPAYAEDQPTDELTVAGVAGRHSSPGARRSWWRRFNEFMFEKTPGEFNSITPRKADGTRTRIFFFNGNGKGR